MKRAPGDRPIVRGVAGRRILLTGATGYTARELAPRLADSGATVVGTARRSDPEGEGVHEWRHLELGESMEQMRAACRGVDAVIHAAALRGERGLPPAEVMAVNVEGTKRLYRAAAAEGVGTFLFLSTVGVCGFAEDVDEDTPYAWDDSSYHTSKARAEEWLNAQNDIPRLLIVRPCVVYGEGRRDGFVYNLAELIRQGLFMPVGWGRPTRLTLVHIDNLTQAIGLVLEHGADGATYVVSDDEALTVDELAIVIARAYRTRIPPFRLPELPVRAAAHLVDVGLRAIGKPPPITPHKLNLFTRPQTFRIDRLRALGYEPTVRPAEGVEAVARAWAVSR